MKYYHHLLTFFIPFQTHLYIHKICHFLTSYVLFAMVNGIILFNVTPVLNNVSKGAYSNYGVGNITLEHSVYIQHPYDYTTDIKGYILVFIFNWYISVTCSTIFCAYDLYLSILVFHVWGHLKILIYNLENFPRPSQIVDHADMGGFQTEWFTEEESKDVFLRLKDLVNHHCLIIE